MIAKFKDISGSDEEIEFECDNSEDVLWVTANSKLGTIIIKLYQVDIIDLRDYLNKYLKSLNHG